MARKTWHDLVYDAILSEGGIASLREVYSWFEQEVPSRLYESWGQAVRRSLLDHSSDSQGYKGSSDLFYSVKGLRGGVWGIRMNLLKKHEDFDFNQLGNTLYEMGEYALAEEAFDQAIKNDTKDTDSSIGLAKSKMKRGKLTDDEAYEIIQSLIDTEHRPEDQFPKSTSIRSRRRGTKKAPSDTEITYIHKKIVARMNRREAKLVGDFAEWISSEKGVKPIFEKNYEDVRFRLNGKSYSVEAKYVRGNSTKAIRSAIGQLMYYNMYPNSTRADMMLVLIQSKPTENDLDWISSLRQRFGEKQFPMYLCWNDKDEYIIDGNCW
jgi:tetratricopeptide (TPR) repeat protein